MMSKRIFCFRLTKKSPTLHTVYLLHTSRPSPGKEFPLSRRNNQARDLLALNQRTIIYRIKTDRFLVSHLILTSSQEQEHPPPTGPRSPIASSLVQRPVQPLRGPPCSTFHVSDLQYRMDIAGDHVRGSCARIVCATSKIQRRTIR